MSNRLRHVDEELDLGGQFGLAEVNGQDEQVIRIVFHPEDPGFHMGLVSAAGRSTQNKLP